MVSIALGESAGAFLQGTYPTSHALIAEKSKGHHAHLASIPNGVHRRNRHPDGQSKNDERRTKAVDPRLGRQVDPSFVIASMA
jgi:hypothetical protein